MTNQERRLREEEQEHEGPNAAVLYDPGEETALSPEEANARIAEAHNFESRIGTLNDLALDLDRAETAEAVIDILGRNLTWLLKENEGGYFAFVALRAQSSDHYVVTALPSLAEGLPMDGGRFHISRGIAGQVISSGTHLSAPLNGCPGFDEELEGEMLKLQMDHIVAVPLKTGGDPIGALVIGRGGGREPKKTEIWILELLSLHAAIAIKNRRLLDDARKRMMQIELVNEIAGQFTQTLELGELLSSAAERIRSTLEYFDVTIFMIEGNHAVLVAHSGAHSDFLPPGYKQPLNQGIVGWVATYAENVVVNNVSADPRYLAYEYHYTQSELAVPIRVEGKVVGVVNVEDRNLNAFDETDAIVLETVCDQLGGMINNAKLYERLLKTNATLTELDRMKSDFLGIVSHDFRTPLASVIMAARAMDKRGEGMDEAKRREYIRIIVDQAEKLKALAEHTLSITRIEAGPVAYNFEVVNVERLVKDAVNLVQFSRRHTIEQHVETNVSYVNADQIKLRQLVHNLLSNAVKYSPRGGRIEIRVEPWKKGMVRFSVSDEGIGIPKGQMNRLFKKFSRVDDPGAKEIKGSGLGLWICQEIVRGHGGEIWVESEQGVGSTFRFTIMADQKEDSSPAGGS